MERFYRKRGKNGAEYTPTNTRYAYTYVLALDGSGMSSLALDKLKNLILDYKDNGQLKELGLYLSQKLNLSVEYNWFMKI